MIHLLKRLLPTHPSSPPALPSRTTASLKVLHLPRLLPGTQPWPVGSLRSSGHGRAFHRVSGSRPGSHSCPVRPLPRRGEEAERQGSTREEEGNHTRKKEEEDEEESVEWRVEWRVEEACHVNRTGLTLSGGPISQQDSNPMTFSHIRLDPVCFLSYCS